MGFVINTDTLMSMIPELLEGRRFVLTYGFGQDHLELLFNSRVSGGWNINLSASQFTSRFRKLMARCGVTNLRGSVAPQDGTESLTAAMETSLSAADMSSTAGEEDLPSPFDIPALVHDHS